MLKITFNTKDLDRLKRTLQKLLHITRQQDVQEQIGLLLSAQAKRNIRAGSADGQQSYRLLRPANKRAILRLINDYIKKTLNKDT